MGVSETIIQFVVTSHVTFSLNMGYNNSADQARNDVGVIKSVSMCPYLTLNTCPP